MNTDKYTKHMRKLNKLSKRVKSLLRGYEETESNLLNAECLSITIEKQERAKEEYNERRHSAKACQFDDEKNCMIPGTGSCDDTCPLNMSCAPKEAT